MLKPSRLSMNLRVRQVEKIIHSLEKIHQILHRNFMKIDGKSSPRASKTTLVTKMHKKTIPGASFSAKDQFLVDFWVSKGTQKLLKTTESFLRKGPQDAPGASTWSKKVPRNGQAPAIEQFSTNFVDFDQNIHRIFNIF